MTVRISLPLTALENPEVAQAMSALMIALGDELGSLPSGAFNLQSAPQSPTPPAEEASASQRPEATVFTAEGPSALLPQLTAYAAQPATPAPRKRRRNRPAPQPTVFEGTATERYEAFKAGLKSQPRAFLDLLEAKGTVTIKDAMEALDIDAPKKIGGITGSISRWAPTRGIRVPFMPTLVEDEKAWIWIGVEGEMPEVLPSAEPAAKAAPVKPAKPAKKAPEASRKLPTLDADKYDAFLEALPEQSRRFMELLRAQGTLQIKEVLDHFSLTRAVAVGGIIEPIRRLSKEHGIEEPFRADLDESDSRIWIWHEVDEAAMAAAEAEAAEEAHENVQPLVSDESGVPHLPGVRRRRVSVG